MQSTEVFPSSSQRSSSVISNILSRFVKTRRGGLARLASVGVCVALTACASLNTPPEETVRQRAADRWKALLADDFPVAHSYSTPSFKAVVPASSFKSRISGPVQWLGAEVTKVQCAEATKCVAQVRIEYRPLMVRSTSGKFETYTEEIWLLEEGQWWIFQAL